MFNKSVTKVGQGTVLKELQIFKFNSGLWEGQSNYFDPRYLPSDGNFKGDGAIQVEEGTLFQD